MERTKILLIEGNPGDARLILFFIIILGSVIWRLTSPEAVLRIPGSYLYLASLVIQFVLVLVLDYYGKKTIYS